eukprot:351106-Chlamydomonas_euryale.AAC.5
MTRPVASLSLFKTQELGLQRLLARYMRPVDITPGEPGLHQPFGAVFICPLPLANSRVLECDFLPSRPAFFVHPRPFPHPIAPPAILTCNVSWFAMFASTCASC